MKKILKEIWITATKSIVAWLCFSFTVWIFVYAASNWENDVTSETYLTADLWNDLKNQVIALQTAQANQPSGGVPTEISPEQVGGGIVAAINGCRNLAPAGEWRLPTAEELTYFVGISGASWNDLLTRTPYYINYPPYNYYTIRLNNGYSTILTSGNFRCVR